jgi:hypothetical protein
MAKKRKRFEVAFVKDHPKGPFVPYQAKYTDNATDYRDLVPIFSVKPGVILGYEKLRITHRRSGIQYRSWTGSVLFPDRTTAYLCTIEEFEAYCRRWEEGETIEQITDSLKLELRMD